MKPETQHLDPEVELETLGQQLMNMYCTAAGAPSGSVLCSGPPRPPLTEL